MDTIINWSHSTGAEYYTLSSSDENQQTSIIFCVPVILNNSLQMFLESFSTLKTRYMLKDTFVSLAFVFLKFSLLLSCWYHCISSHSQTAFQRKRRSVPQD